MVLATPVGGFEIRVSFVGDSSFIRKISVVVAYDWLTQKQIRLNVKGK